MILTAGPSPMSMLEDKILLSSADSHLTLSLMEKGYFDDDRNYRYYLRFGGIIQYSEFFYTDDFDEIYNKYELIVDELLDSI